MNDDGRLSPEIAACFERVLPGPIERVWEFLTASEHVAAWFGGGTMRYVIESRVGGEVSLADRHIRGVVTQWQPPKLLAYTWNVFSPGETESPYPESYLRFELKTLGSDVLLTLTHRPVLTDFGPQTLMGWHTFLEMLGTLLAGGEPEPRDAIMARNRVRYGVQEIKR